MPIAGKTDTHRQGAGIPLLARLYKGQPRDEKRPKWTPPELPYFRVEFEPAFERFAPLFARMYGEQPVEINGALLLGAQPEDAFTTWMEQWAVGARLVRRCTGETIVDQFNPETQKMARSVMLPCQQGAVKPCECKQVGRLGFILPEFMRASGVIGSFMLTTHGWYDIGKIDATIKDAHALFGGSLHGVPFTLYRQAVDLAVAYKDKDSGEMKRTTKAFNMALLRVQEGYVNGALQLPPINDRLLDAETGELLSSGAPALPSGANVPLFETVEEASTFANEMKGRYKGITPKQIAEALGVTRLAEFYGSRQEAEALVDNYWMES